MWIDTESGKPKTLIKTCSIATFQCTTHVGWPGR